MNMILLAFSSLAFSSIGVAQTTAQTILTCKGSSGSITKSIVLIKEGRDHKIITVDYTNQKAETKIKEVETAPPSTKYVYDLTADQKNSLVISNSSKQAVMLYEVIIDGKPKVTVDFLVCK